MRFTRALKLLKNEKRGTALQRRLILFFASVTVFIVLAFTLLLMLFGINGGGEKAVRDYAKNELAHVREALSADFNSLSLLGIDMAEQISSSCDDFFSENGIKADELASHPELIEPLLAEQTSLLSSAMQSNSSSGALILLDATVNPDAKTASTSRAGFYIRSTQPLPVKAVSAKYFCLRGPAKIARDNKIELLGQWRMEYDITGEEFFSTVMDTARKNAQLPLSRLYYWTERVMLHGNSEAAFLLLLPLRTADGTVFGVCGLEVSDRMFKQLYSPKESDYDDVFILASPATNVKLSSSGGLIAGNSYLSGYRMEEDMDIEQLKNGFFRFYGSKSEYGGLFSAVRLYPTGSPYENEGFAVAALMPKEALDAAIKGNSAYLIYIVAALVIASLTASVFISRRYITPVERELERLYEQQEGVKTKFDEVSSELKRLKKQEIDPETYAHFTAAISTLTKREREIFELYLKGSSTKEIVEELGFSENALKYHNKNIYSKLGVSSRKELLLYGEALMAHKDGK